jgi:ATP synthase protein I
MTNDNDSSERHPARLVLKKKVAAKQRRKMEARREGDRSAWFGLGMFGLVGWSVAIPTLIGIAIGLWIDGRWPSRFSWTLMLLLVGLSVGCLNAWWWVQRESREPLADRGDSSEGESDG